jgi:adenylate cyclase
MCVESGCSDFRGCQRTLEGPARARGRKPRDGGSVATGLFGELKRRNVFRVGAGYAVVAWLLLQAADILLGNFGAPDWAFKSLTVIVLLGFPLALFLAWAYEMTPEGVVRTARRDAGLPPIRTGPGDYLLAAVLVVVGALILMDLVGGPSIGPAPELPLAGLPEVEPSPGIEPADASIAVLPFANMSPDPENEFFADGISEEVLNVVSRIEGLSVASRTSSFSFRGTGVDVADIAARLRVAHVLEGSVRKHGERVRITAQLIDAKRDRQLWSDSFDRELEDIFAIQGEIAQAIADALRDTLGIRQVKVAAPTSNLEAYEFYLRGRELFTQRREMTRAQELLERAVELDPDFASAWGTLAAIRVVLHGYAPTLDASATFARARVAAERALALDRDQPAALSALAMLDLRGGQRANSARLLRQVLETHPNDSSAWLWLGIGQADAGQLDAAIQSVRRAATGDPMSGIAHGWLATFLLMLSDAEGAGDPLGRARELGSFSILREIDLALDDGRREDAARLMRAWKENPIVWYPPLSADEIRTLGEAVARAMEDSAQRPAAVSMIQASVERRPAINHWAWFKFAGAYEETIREALRPEAALPPEYTLANFWWPRYRGMRSMPEFFEFATQLGVVEYWEELGYPDFCTRVDESPPRLECTR